MHVETSIKKYYRKKKKRWRKALGSNEKDVPLTLGSSPNPYIICCTATEKFRELDQKTICDGRYAKCRNLKKYWSMRIQNGNIERKNNLNYSLKHKF